MRTRIESFEGLASIFLDGVVGLASADFIKREATIVDMRVCASLGGREAAASASPPRA